MGGGKKMTRAILRTSRTDYREWRWETVPSRIEPIRLEGFVQFYPGLGCTCEETVLHIREASGVMQ